MTKQICLAFESGEKSARFGRVMDLMTRMQALGNPPKELVGPGDGRIPDMMVPEGLPDQCKMS